MKTFETLRLKRFKLTFNISLICLIAAIFVIWVNWEPISAEISLTGIFLGFTAGFFVTLILISGGAILSEKKKNPPKPKKNLFMTDKDREGNIVEFSAFISLAGIVIGAIFGVLSVFYENSIFGTIATLGITTFILPFVLMQFFMSANIYPKNLGGTYLLFYLIVFPVVDILIFTALNSLIHIVPTYYYSHNRGTVITAEEIEIFKREALLYVGTIYIILNGAGLLWRIGKNVIRKNQLVLLSL